MLQWGTFVVASTARAAIDRAVEALRERQDAFRRVKQPRLLLVPDARKRLSCLQVDGFADGVDAWNWHAEHLQLGGVIAAAVRAKAYGVLSINGAAYEEWVVAYSATGKKRWEARRGDRTPFTRLRKELGVDVRGWLEPESGLPELATLSTSLLPEKPKRAPAGQKIRATIEVPAEIRADGKQLAASWARAGEELSGLASRAALFERVPKLPLVGARRPVEVRIGANHWKAIQAEATRLSVDPGRLLTAALLMNR